MLRTFSLTFLFLIAAGSFPNDAAAQVVFGDPPAASARFVYQSWTIEDDLTGDDRKLSQWYFPVYGFIPVSERWEIHISSASAGTQSDSSGNDVSITGLNDTRISVLRSLLNNRVLVGAGLNLPTGKAALDPDQSGLRQLLTADFLNVPSKIYGEGFGLFVEAAYSRQIDKLMFGVGAGFLLNSSYSPLDGVDGYNPGNRLIVAANAAYRHRLGTAYSYLRRTEFAVSSQGGTDVYKVGAITEFLLGTTINKEQFEIDAGLRIIFRQADSRLVAGGLTEYEHNNYGNDLRFYSNLGYRMEGIGKPLMLIDYKRVGANGFGSGDDEYAGKSNLFGIGAGFEKSVTDRLDVSITSTAYLGSADDSRLDLTGIELALSGRMTF